MFFTTQSYLGTFSFYHPKHFPIFIFISFQTLLEEEAGKMSRHILQERAVLWWEQKYPGAYPEEWWAGTQVLQDKERRTNYDDAIFWGNRGFLFCRKIFLSYNLTKINMLVHFSLDYLFNSKSEALLGWNNVYFISSHWRWIKYCMKIG